MEHAIYKVTGFEMIGDYRLRVEFDDDSWQEIDFGPILKGQLFGPLQDPELFAKVRLDDEAYTLVWPTGADLDPTTLHDWPSLQPQMVEMAKRWEMAEVQV